MSDRMVKDNHLGGFVEGGDERCFYPKLWDALIKDFNIKSVIDVGCGQGHALKYFKEKGVKGLGIDGSEKVLENAVFTPIEIFDYTKGKIRFISSSDLIWSSEFVEHVEEEFIGNFLDTFKQGKIIAMSHALPGQGGYHHVNEQPDIYWIEKMELLGYHLSSRNQHYRNLAHDYFQKSGLVFLKA